MYLTFSFCLIKKINAPYPLLQYLFFILNPVLLFVCVWNAPSVLCYTFVAALIILLTKNFYWYDICILFFCCVLIFGSHESSLLLLPLILCIIIFGKNLSKIQKIFSCFAVVLSLVFIFVFPLMYQVEKIPIYSGGFAWEMLDMTQKLSQEERVRYFYNIADEKSLNTAIERIKQDENSLNSYYWDNRNDLSAYNIGKNKSSGRIIKQYLKLAKDKPEIFIYTKSKFIKRTLGITKPLMVCFYEDSKDIQKAEVFFDNSEATKILCKIFNNAANGSLIRYPWLVFLISLCMLLIEIYRKSFDDKLYMLIFSFAVLLYGTFVITTHAFEIRYFLPSFCLLYIMDVAIACSWLKNFQIKNKK